MIEWSLAFCTPFLIAGLFAAEPRENAIVDFAQQGEVSEWRIVNDGVMGGLSTSRIGAASDSTAGFVGSLSLENNGGFASVRRMLDEPLHADTDGLILRVRGDGRRYQFRLRTNDNFDGIAYAADFDTRADEWMRVDLPLTEFEATFRGRNMPDAPPLLPTDVRQMTFLLGDKTPGEFALEIRSIAVRP